MSWRKWFIRCLVFSIAGATGGAVLLYQAWTNPAAVRQSVLAKVQEVFPGAQVIVDGARLRLLGGIQLSELRLARKDDPDRDPILHVPSAILHHDKERLLDGELKLRKVEMHRPHLRLERDREGNWNIDGITGPLKTGVQLPTMVMHQGTLILDDRRAGHQTIEFTDVSLTFINDPVQVVAIQGTGTSEITGSVQFQGHWHREAKQIMLTIKALGVPLASLPGKLASFVASDRLDGLSLEGKADAEAELTYQFGVPGSFTYDVRCRVHKGKVRHPQLPLPLEEAEASLRIRNGEVRLEHLKARSGQAQVEAKGIAELPALEKSFEGVLEVKHLPMCDELCNRLPDKIQNLHALFQPKGLATVRVECARRDGRWATLSSGAPPRITLIPEEIGVCFERFPYPLERVSGSLEWNLLNGEVGVDVLCHAGARPVFVKGSWKGSGPDADASFDIQATEVPLDEKMIAALPVRYQKQARSFQATGKADLKAHIRHVPGSTGYANEYHVRFHDCAVRWQEFPYPLENVEAFLDIYPERWEFHDCRGTHNGGEVIVQGHSAEQPDLPATGEAGLYLEITGRKILLDGDLHKALGRMPALAKAWTSFAPQGRLNFTAKIDRQPGKTEDLDIAVDVRGCSIEPEFFPFVLSDLSGSFRFHKNRLTLADVSARHGPTQFRITQGAVDVHAGGGYYADLQDLRFQKLFVEDQFLKALPKALQAVCANLELRDELNGRTRLIIAQSGDPGSAPDLYWDGQLWLSNARLKAGIELAKVTGTVAAVGRYNGRQLVGVTGNVMLDKVTLLHQPFQNVHARFQVKENAPEVLLVDLRAPVHGGDITGQVRLEFHSTLRYELNLTASQIDLQEFGRHNLGATAQLQGVAVGRLHLTGQGSSIQTLEGNGSLDVPSGRLLNLPLLFDLLKFLGLRWPDRTAFEELHALFSVHGNRVAMRRLDLIGNAISLSGKGEFNIDGTDLQLDFYPSWARLEQILPPSVRSIPPAITKNLMQIEMRGKVGTGPNDLKFTKKPVPALVSPFLYMRDRLTGVAAGGSS